MAIGKPILMCVGGDAADLVARAGAGVLCQPGTAEAMAEGSGTALKWGLKGAQRWAKRGYGFYQRELLMAAGVRKFVEVFERAHRGGGQLNKRIEGQAG
jgi:colanic acid biosynthesis glycosyl transferase WcaI